MTAASSFSAPGSGQGGLPPFALYVHIPYCRRKCRYCDFPSRAGAPDPGYSAALLAELTFWRRHLAWDGRPLLSVYWGGGTPSLMPVADIKQILRHIASLWPLDPAVEITLEANPDSLTLAALEGYRQAGVNRVSLGVQAMTDARLRWLGRPHDVAGARRAVASLRAAGMPRWSLDLIYATPGQTWEAWQQELDAVLELAPPHLSCYTLTLAPDTPLGRRWQRGTLIPVDEETEREFLLRTRATLTAAGLPPYEISNFARPGEESRHNLNYWQFGDYLGVGAGSHGKVTGPDGQVTRFVNLVDEGGYRQRMARGGPPWWRRRVVPREELATERVIMALRATAGLDLAAHVRAVGVDLLATRGEVIRVMGEEGLVVVEGGRLRLTELGVPLAHGVMRALM